MEYILSGKEMARIDKLTSDEFGIDSFTLMERAALETAHFILKQIKPKKVAVFVGTGNNGGDGIALARILWEYGVFSDIYLIGDSNKASALTKKQLEIISKYPIKVLHDWTLIKNKDYDIIVDSLFGIGLNRDITGEYKEVIDFINLRNEPKLSIDIPSGINADTGKIMGTAVKCDYTCTYASKKYGQFLYPGREYCGELICFKIGIPVELLDNKNSFIYDNTDQILPKRLTYGNKGSFGKILIIAGSKAMGGAALLCGKSALRSGAGMVKIITATQNRELLLNALPEAMVDTYDTKEEFEELFYNGLSWCDVVAAGPGLSTEKLSKEIIGIILNNIKKTIVLDADALNIIAHEKNYLELVKQSQYKIIFTPHLGEFARLLNIKVSDLKENIIESCTTFAKEYGIILVCKDACTVVTDGNKIYLNTSGNDGMATAGSGDVLTGITASFIGQNEKTFEAVTGAVYCHGLAGDIAKDNSSAYYIIANDIIDAFAKLK